LVFAKLSGRSDPDDRLFLIFEGVLPNPMPGSLKGCLPAAQAWAALESEPDPRKRAAGLEALFFDGLPGFEPVVHYKHFGLHAPHNASYGHSMGQVRISQQMEKPWNMREFHLLLNAPSAGPKTLFRSPQSTS
jgi:hypothetical protein